VVLQVGESRDRSTRGRAFPAAALWLAASTALEERFLPYTSGNEAGDPNRQDRQ
jgi:hypothetical protein